MTEKVIFSVNKSYVTDLEIAQQSFCMMHYHAKFGYKRFL